MQTIEVDSSTFEQIEGFDDLSEIGQQAAYNYTDHVAKKKTRQTKRKSKTASGKGFFGILKKVGQTAGDVTIWAPIAPLRPMMRKALAAKGKDPGKKTHTGELAKIFYNEIVSKQGNYEEINIDFDLQSDNIVDEAATAIISGIIEFIKGIKKKKAEGKQLNKTEQVITDGTEIAETKIKESAQNEAATAVGKSILFDRKTQLILAVVLIGIILLVWYFRKNQ